MPKLLPLKGQNCELISSYGPKAAMSWCFFYPVVMWNGTIHKPRESSKKKLSHDSFSKSVFSCVHYWRNMWTDILPVMFSSVSSSCTFFRLPLWASKFPWLTDVLHKVSRCLPCSEYKKYSIIKEPTYLKGTFTQTFTQNSHTKKSVSYFVSFLWFCLIKPYGGPV